jgi:nuclear pore complex protein Nup62
MSLSLFIAPAAAPTSTTGGGGLFGLPPKPAESTSASGPTAHPAAGASATSTGVAGSTGTTSTTPGGGLFGGGSLFGKTPVATGTSTIPAAGSTTGTAATPAPSLFGAKTDEKKDGGAAPASSKTYFYVLKTILITDFTSDFEPGSLWCPETRWDNKYVYSLCKYSFCSLH